MFRFFTSKINSSGFLIEEKFDIKHITTVLRLTPGDHIEIVNDTQVYEGVIDSLSKSAVRGSIIKPLEAVSDKIEFRLFLATIRPRLFELVIEKATELGVSEIIPVVMKNSQFSVDVYSSKHERFKKIIVAASKQSKQVRVPLISYPIAILNLADNILKGDLNVMFDLGSKSVSIDSIKSKLLKHKRTNCFVGPEGGFSKEDKDNLNDLDNLFTIKLSDHILRAETAAIVGLGIMKALAVDS
ncbi:16S rRNA (uracil(1498)-N(3))-methyltransferase [Candidatus Dojkabacteria bacterium]|nr:16S rRNA (uracil(1498)-N(3))-methyltransferase [Candidatus Dojkabacteria bacterium]